MYSMNSSMAGAPSAVTFTASSVSILQLRIARTLTPSLPVASFGHQYAFVTPRPLNRGPHSSSWYKNARTSSGCKTERKGASKTLSVRHELQWKHRGKTVSLSHLHGASFAEL